MAGEPPAPLVPCDHRWTRMHTDGGDAKEFDRMNGIYKICRVGVDPLMRGMIAASRDSRLRGNDKPQRVILSEAEGSLQ